MNDDDSIQYIFWGAIAMAAYAFYKKGLPSLTAPLVNPLADAWANLTSGPAAQATGTIAMPDGSTIPASSIQMTNMQTDQFNYSGQTYTLTEDADGNFVAQ